MCILRITTSICFMCLDSLKSEFCVNLTRSFIFQLISIKEAVAQMTGRDRGEVRVVVSPYRICPLGAHIDHQVCL